MIEQPRSTTLLHPPRGHADGADLGPVKAYWERLRQGRGVPARTDIDPDAIQPYLGQSGIVERTATGAVKVRLAGRRLEALMRMEMRGMPLRAMFTVAHRDRLDAIVAQVFDGPRLLTLSLSAAFEGQPLVTAQLALMPLSDPHGRISRALMVMTPQSAPAAMPCRFDIRHAHLGSPCGDATPDATADGRPRLRVIDGGLA